MRIAVVIPVYNVVAYLEEALRSVRAQEYGELEIWVVDDGSKPQHAAEIDNVCARYPEVNLLRQENRGPAAARDFGVSQCNADAVLFLDADDLLLPGAVRFFVNALQRHPQAVAAYAQAVKVDAAGRIMGEIVPKEEWRTPGVSLLELLLEGRMTFFIGAICIRREIFRHLKINYYHLRMGEEKLLWCHLALTGEIIYAGPQLVVHRRQHGANVTAKSLDQPEQTVQAYETLFADPVFACAVGNEKLQMLKERCLCRVYTRFAKMYAKTLQPEKAAYFLEKISLNLPDFAA